jgi:hypothetical protein
MREDNGLKVYVDALSEALKNLGRLPTIRSEQLKEMMEEVGFVDVQVFKVKQPHGPWPKDQRIKEIGAMNLLSGHTAYHAYGKILSGLRGKYG